MRVTHTTFTIADYCKAMSSKEIYPNKEYQRSDQVWPPAARSYLIDTILLGYPIPKLSLAQKTDLKSRRTYKEIVDGQQRSQAILDFYEGKFQLTSKSEFSGKRYATLDPEQQQAFLDYGLSVDLFVGATPADIRQVFRRINSYTVPLNPQEQRHARFQGPFKWFIVDLTQQYAQTLVDIGVFQEKKISRMADAQLFTEITMAILDGMTTYSRAKIDKFYEAHDDTFSQETQVSDAFEHAFTDVISMELLHHTEMMKERNFFTLMIGLMHIRHRYPSLLDIYDAGTKKKIRIENAEANLTLLAEALASEEPLARLTKYVEASKRATNTVANRRERLKWCCKAIDRERI